MVALDANLIESGKEVKFSGIVKSQFMENSGIPVINAGTVDSWWITGYLPEEEIKIAVTTGKNFDTLPFKMFGMGQKVLSRLT